MTYKILALGGGGSKGILHVGVIKAIEEFGLNFEEIYGCSIGSIYATAIAFGLNSEALERMSAKFSSFNEAFIGKLTLLGLSDSLTKKGLFKMDMLEDFVVNLILDETGINLREKKISDAPIPLRICASNITKKCLTVFEGDFPIMKAIRASCCIPVLFCPQTINGCLYIDGGFLTNIILDYIQPEKRKQTFSVSIIHNNPNLTPENTFKLSYVEFLYGLYKVACLYERKINLYKNNIDLKYNITGISDVGPKERNEMILHGYESARRFLSENCGQE